MERLSYDYLYDYWLMDQTTGQMGEFNKKYFPNSYKEMLAEMERRANAKPKDK